MDADEIRPILDDAERIQQIDTRNMLRQISEFPEQLETALGIARSYRDRDPGFEPSLVYLKGAGVAGHSAAIAVEMSNDRAAVPVIAGRGGGIPSYVGSSSLVVLIDYQGDERLAARVLPDALSRGARVVCVAAGGALAEAAAEQGVTVVSIPSGQTPRAAIGYMIAQALGVMAQYRVINSADEILFSAAKFLKAERESLRVESPTSRNPAKQAAQFFLNRIPVILAAPDYRSVVAWRLRSQLGANSKRPAFARGIFDLSAGEISAWEMPETHGCEFCFVLLTDPRDADFGIAPVMDRIEKVVGERYGVMRLNLRGWTIAEKLMDGLFLSDYISCYLAILYGVDPTQTAYANAISHDFRGQASEDIESGEGSGSDELPEIAE